MRWRGSATPRATSTDYRHPHRPWPLAWANRAGSPLAAALGAAERLLDEGALLAAARRATGLRGLAGAIPGEHDLRVLAPLRRLLRALREEARLHPVGLLMVRENLVRILSNRLRIEAALARRPELVAQPIEPPLFIVGLQRTGTTLLHRLLAQDEGLRVLASWEAINPAPLPPSRLARWGRRAAAADRRIGAAEIAERALRLLSPDFFAIHPVEAHAPEEDCLLFDYTFYSTVFEATLRVPSYSTWLEQQDHRPAYRYYAAILAYLLAQRGAGTRWLLKTPHHMEQLDVLLETFPGARVIQPHRDPLRVLASFCSMVAHGRGVFSDAVDPHEVGTSWSAKLQRMIGRCLAAREAAQDRGFVDVAYAELVADPLAAVQRIYRSLDRPLEPRTEQRMRAWLTRNPQHRHGRHRYDLADFGLRPDAVAAGFAAYRRRFAIPNE